MIKDSMQKAIDEFNKASEAVDKQLEFSFMNDKDPVDLWDDEEITQIVKELNVKPSKPWFDLSSWYPKEYKCTCGSEKTYGKGAPHSQWCDSVKR